MRLQRVMVKKLRVWRRNNMRPIKEDDGVVDRGVALHKLNHNVRLVFEGGTRRSLEAENLRLAAAQLAIGMADDDRSLLLSERIEAMPEGTDFPVYGVLT